MRSPDLLLRDLADCADTEVGTKGYLLRRLLPSARSGVFDVPRFRVVPAGEIDDALAAVSVHNRGWASAIPPRPDSAPDWLARTYSEILRQAPFVQMLSKGLSDDLWVRTSIASLEPAEFLAGPWSLAGLNSSRLLRRGEDASAVVSSCLVALRRCYVEWYLSAARLPIRPPRAALIVARRIPTREFVSTRIGTDAIWVDVDSTAPGSAPFQIQLERARHRQRAPHNKPLGAGPDLLVRLLDAADILVETFSSPHLDAEFLVDQQGRLWCTQCRPLRADAADGWSTPGTFEFTTTWDLSTVPRTSLQTTMRAISRATTEGGVLLCALADPYAVDVFALMWLLQQWAPGAARSPLAIVVPHAGSRASHILLAVRELHARIFLGQADICFAHPGHRTAGRLISDGINAALR